MDYSNLKPVHFCIVTTLAGIPLCVSNPDEYSQIVAPTSVGFIVPYTYTHNV